MKDGNSDGKEDGGDDDGDDDDDEDDDDVDGDNDDLDNIKLSKEWHSNEVRNRKNNIGKASKNKKDG